MQRRLLLEDVNCFNEPVLDDGKENVYDNFRAIYEVGYEGGVHPNLIGGSEPGKRAKFLIGQLWTDRRTLPEVIRYRGIFWSFCSGRYSCVF